MTAVLPFVAVLPPPVRLGPAATAVVLATVAYLVLVAPLTGRRAYRRLSATRDTDPAALVGFFRRNVVRKSLWLVPVAALVLLVPGMDGRQLGLVWPYGPYASGAWATFLYLALVVLASGLLWRRRVQRGRPVPGQRMFRALLPRTPAERGWAAAVALSAGVCEELLTRGLLIAAGRAAGLSLVVVVLATSLAFGIPHLYQGWLGVAVTTALGLAFAGLYVTTGSLLFPIAIHVLIDIRGLLMVPPPAPAGPAPPPAPAAPQPTPAPPPGTGLLRPAAPDRPD